MSLFYKIILIFLPFLASFAFAVLAFIPALAAEENGNGPWQACKRYFYYTLTPSFVALILMGIAGGSWLKALGLGILIFALLKIFSPARKQRSPQFLWTHVQA